MFSKLIDWLGVTGKTLERILLKYEKWIVCGLLILFVLIYVLVSYNKHLNLASALFDQGLQEQVIWNTSNGNWFGSSPETTNFLGDHFSFSLILIAGIYKIFPATLTLIVLQAVGIALGVLGFYLLSKMKLKGIIWPIVILLTLLIYRPLSGPLLFDVHEIAFAFPFLAFGILAIEKKKLRLAFLLLFIAIGFKEDVAVFVGMLGFYYGWFRKQKWGYIVFGLCVIYAALALLVFIPYFRGEAADTVGRYSLSSLFQYGKIGKLKYLFMLFAPAIAVVFALPELLILIGPSLAVNLLASFPAQYGAAAQYDIMITVAIFYSLILAIAKMQKLAFEKKFLNIQALVILIMIVSNVFFLINHRMFIVVKDTAQRGDDRVALYNLMQDIPKDKNISTSNNLGAYFAQYPNLFLFDPPWLPQKVKYDYLVIDRLSYSNYMDLYSDNSEYIESSSKGNISVFVNKVK